MKVIKYTSYGVYSYFDQFKDNQRGLIFLVAAKTKKRILELYNEVGLNVSAKTLSDYGYNLENHPRLGFIQEESVWVTTDEFYFDVNTCVRVDVQDFQKWKKGK